MTILKIFLSTAFVALFAWIVMQDDFADAQEGFFHGKTIRIVVGSSPGGGYDYWARLLARHMPKHIPGNLWIAIKPPT
jgi:tripartite-type tricarboxylate transporter receptor subunit TctC